MITILKIGTAVIFAVFYIRLLLCPVRDVPGVSFRARFMMGGRRSIYWGLYACAAWVFFLFLIWNEKLSVFAEQSTAVKILESVLGILGALLLIGAGSLRIFFTSRRLSVVWRLALLMTWWIPVINLAVLLFACRLVYEEYDCERERVRIRNVRKDPMPAGQNILFFLYTGIGFQGSEVF